MNFNKLDVCNIKIIVPVHNEEQNVVNCLTSICNATIPKNTQIKIYTVLNGCTDNSEKFVKDFIKTKSNICFKNYKWSGKSKAINKTLVLCASDDICVIIDSDTTISDNFLIQIEKDFRNKNIHVIGADYIGNLSSIPSNTYLHKFELVEHAIRIINPATIPIGRFIAFRRKDFMKLPENIHSEDSYIGLDIWHRYGKDSVFMDLSIKSMYFPAKNWEDLIAQRTRWNQGTEQLLKKYPYLMTVIKEKEEILSQNKDLLYEKGFSYLKENGLSENDVKYLLFIIQVILKENATLSNQYISSKGSWKANISTKSL